MVVLLNGPPASGKSTLASRLVATRPLALALDIDVVRSLLGAWLDDPVAAGLAARDLAVTMARGHLRAGHDVFVPQFLARTEFIDRLQDVAVETGARFIEIALVIDRTVALESFQRRRERPEQQVHLDAAALVERSEAADPVGEMFDRYLQLLDRRPNAHRVEVKRTGDDRVEGDVEATVRDIETLLR